MASRGRPTKYTPEIVERICAGLREGKSLRSICEGDDMPSEAAVRTWAQEDREGFYTHYARAREIGYGRMAEELLEIADEENKDDTQRARLRVDTRKWLLAKALPKVYGDRITHAGDSESPIETRTVSDLEVAKQIAFLLSGNKGE